MHILLFNFYKMPNPDYQNMAHGLRERGHTLWLGVWNKQGELQWHDGEQVIASLPGPVRQFGRLNRLPIIRSVAMRLSFLAFIGRLRHFIGKVKPDIVQVDSGTFFSPWALPIGVASDIRFIFDIRHINIGISRRFTGRFKEWQIIKTRKLYGKYFYDHACFNHEATARKVLGNNWRKWGTAVRIGISPNFLLVNPTGIAHEQENAPVRFIYVGAITKFRELEQLIYAAQKMATKTTCFQIDLIGPDKSNGFYQQFIDKLELNHVVAIKPPMAYEAVPKLMSTYDVGLAYTPDRRTWDYQPTIKVLEYRALGLPILSIDVASHHEIVENGVNGLLVKHSIDTIAEGLLCFVQNRSFLNQCRTNAHQMRQGLTISEVAQIYEQDVYQKLKPEFESH